MSTDTPLHPDRLFDPDPAVRDIARQLYADVREEPIVSPHGHVNPALFSDPNASFGNPTALLVIPDHYVFRMLYSQGVPLESLGVPRADGESVEEDPKKIWRTFAEHFHLFRGCPSGMWLTQELVEVFGIDSPLNGDTASEIYDDIDAKLNTPEFSPRSLFDRLDIEVLATTDAAGDTLKHHRAIAESDWNGRIIPTFRPDAVTNLAAPGWTGNIEELSEVSDIDITDYSSFISALEQRRGFFKEMGATATDSAAVTPHTKELSATEADALFQNALKGNASANDAARFTAHMLMEMARMSADDGLVMQFHPGCARDHNSVIFERFGPDKGCDIPVPCDFTGGLKALLNKYGNNAEFTLVVFTLDEDTYSRELAPLAGHYPAMRLGPPWWFHDSMNGIERYLDRVMETTGLYNTAGFNDDTRAFPSIPARHDVWRRSCANWLARMVSRHVILKRDALDMMGGFAAGLARGTYKLNG
ncbi:glucuronate isomerase [Planctomycetota bacterium]